MTFDTGLRDGASYPGVTDVDDVVIGHDRALLVSMHRICPSYNPHAESNAMEVRLSPKPLLYCTPSEQSDELTPSCATFWPISRSLPNSNLHVLTRYTLEVHSVFLYVFRVRRGADG